MVLPMPPSWPWGRSASRAVASGFGLPSSSPRGFSLLHRPPPTPITGFLRAALTPSRVFDRAAGSHLTPECATTNHVTGEGHILGFPPLRWGGGGRGVTKRLSTHGLTQTRLQIHFKWSALVTVSAFTLNC